MATKGWMHMDCAGTYRKSQVINWAAGATGMGVRTLARILIDRQNNNNDERCFDTAH
ncbi:hypothetical protein OK016_12760 [Vibrio chagasii]|nr:hypothetical protein [Vibrio chagasii]